MVAGEVLPWLVCVLVWSLASAEGVGSKLERSLLGAAIDLTQKELSYFGLTGKEDFKLQSKSNCRKPLPIPVRANSGRLCGLFLRIRECLEFTATQPVWIARGCKGQACMAKNSYEETLCLLGNYGIDIDVKNTTRSCGIDSSDGHWLTPNVNPVAHVSADGEPSCSVVIPKGVESYIWADCVNGKPEVRYELRFSEQYDMGTDPYSCLVSPTCGNDGLFKSMMVCYSEAVKEADGTNVSLQESAERNCSHHESSARQNYVPVGMVLGVIVVAYLMDIFGTFCR